MNRNRFFLLFLCLCLAGFSAEQNDASEPKNPCGVFSFSHELVLPGTPEVIYDAATGDISGWWDHSFSGNPHKLYIKAKPGGGFYEIFDE